MRVRSDDHLFGGFLLLLSLIVGAMGTLLLAYLLICALFWLVTGTYY